MKWNSFDPSFRPVRSPLLRVSLHLQFSSAHGVSSPAVRTSLGTLGGPRLFLLPPPHRLTLPDDPLTLRPLQRIGAIPSASLQSAHPPVRSTPLIFVRTHHRDPFQTSGSSIAVFVHPGQTTNRIALSPGKCWRGRGRFIPAASSACQARSRDFPESVSRAPKAAEETRPIPFLKRDAASSKAQHTAHGVSAFWRGV